MHDVFLSYSSIDQKAADAVCHALESAGVRVWMASRDIIPGADWAASIVEAINVANVFVLVFSANSNRSYQVKRELDIATNRNIPLIPVRIENIRPTGAIEYYLSSAHWLDLYPPPIYLYFERLCAIVKSLVISDSDNLPSTPQLLYSNRLSRLSKDYSSSKIRNLGERSHGIASNSRSSSNILASSYFRNIHYVFIFGALITAVILYLLFIRAIPEKITHDFLSKTEKSNISDQYCSNNSVFNSISDNEKELQFYLTRCGAAGEYATRAQIQIKKINYFRSFSKSNEPEDKIQIGLNYLREYPSDDPIRLDYIKKSIQESLVVELDQLPDKSDFRTKIKFLEEKIDLFQSAGLVMPYATELRESLKFCDDPSAVRNDRVKKGSLENYIAQCSQLGGPHVFEATIKLSKLERPEAPAPVDPAIPPLPSTPSTPSNNQQIKNEILAKENLSAGIAAELRRLGCLTDKGISEWKSHVMQVAIHKPQLEKLVAPPSEPTDFYLTELRKLKTSLCIPKRKARIVGKWQPATAPPESPKPTTRKKPVQSERRCLSLGNVDGYCE